MRRFALAATALALVACQPAEEPTAPPVETPAPTTPPLASVTPPKVALDYGENLRLTGNEPFWGATIDDETVTITRMDHADLSAPNTGAVITGEIAMWNSDDFSIRLSPADCSDGMSDNRYPYEATVTISGEVLKGCAAPADEWPSGGG